MQSVLSVHPFVSTLSLIYEATRMKIFLHVFGHDHSSSRIENQSHRLRSEVNANMCVLHECLMRRPISTE